MTTPNMVSAYSGLPVIQAIPTNIAEGELLSKTSLAAECFINQRFSNKLQAFLISYVNNIQSTYPVFAV